LRDKKICALIVQFGKNEHDYTSDSILFKHLKVIELDLNKEFFNQYFQLAFERMMKEFLAIYERITNF